MQGAVNVFLSLGSNMGDRFKNLRQATALVNVLGAIPFSINPSPVYETAPWGKTDQPAFLNAVIGFETVVPPDQLMQNLLHCENLLGRERDEKWGPRTIDIDMLYYGSHVIELGHLRIPHPELAARRFVLQPLCDIAPDFIHPILKRTNRQLLEICPDPLQVQIVDVKLPKTAL